jgi:prepilin-type N-terminal cleavage/methylation domain-containing protein
VSATFDGTRSVPATLRRGVTLTELLVVVSIVVLLSSMLVPLVQPVMRGQRVREAARQVNVYLAGAQARAVEQGRPMGVWIERAGHEVLDAPNLWYTAHRLYPAEQPEPYTGDLFESRMRLRPNASDPTFWEAWYDWDPIRPQLKCCELLDPAMKLAIASADPRLALALPGDMIRFNGRGQFYVINQIDQYKITFRVRPDQIPNLAKFLRPPPSDPTDQAALMAYQPGVPFEIIRRPVKSSGTPIELPRNTGIDLSLSGYGLPYNTPYNALPAYDPLIYDPSQFAARFREVHPEYDVVIMFRPEGGVDRVYYVSHELEVLSFWEVPQGMISLLVARDDQIGRDSMRNVNVAGPRGQDMTTPHLANVVGPLGEANLQDQDNIWLSISTHTGRIQSFPNGNAFADAMTGLPLVNLPLTPTDDARVFLQNARRFATTGQSMGGQ